MRNFDTGNVSKNTGPLRPVDSVPTLDPAVLDAASAAAAKEFIAEGTPENTRRSYESALRYVAAWYALRYGRAFGDGPISVAVASQFILDHLERTTRNGLQYELPPAVDERLVAVGVKAKRGALTRNTVVHRLAVLAKWHRLRDYDSPTDDHRVKTLLTKARKAQARRNVKVRKKTAVVAEPFKAMLATCTDGLRGIRDRALLQLAWSGGGRRRSELANLRVEDLRRIDERTWTYALGNTKTDSSGTRREKPLIDDAAVAIQAWLDAARLESGPLFRRLYRSGKVGESLTGDHIARIVQRRAKIAGLSGDFAAHSLRSGFVTEAGRQGVPIGEVMGMTEHRSLSTLMGYFQAGSLINSKAARLLRPEQPSEGDATE